MLFFWANEFLRPLTHLGVWLFANTENEVLSLDARGERRVDAYGSEGSPFARLQPDLHAGDTTSGLDEDPLRRLRRQQQRTAQTTQQEEGQEPHQMTASVSRNTQRNTHATPSAEDKAAALTVYLSTAALLSLLEYRLESAPLPLAVAAAGPRLRLAGELASVFYFPGAAASVRPVGTSSAASHRYGHNAATGAAAVDTSFHTADALQGSSGGLGWSWSSVAAAAAAASTPQYTRRLRGTSLQSLIPAMRHSAWWYGRPAPDFLCGGRDGWGIGGEEKAEAQGLMCPSPSCPRCLPLSVEVVAPRGAPALVITSSHNGASSAASLPRRAARWLRETAAGLLRGGPATTTPRHPLLTPLDAELQRAVQEFVLLVDQLWCVRRCRLVELAVERYPLPLVEWLLSPDLHPDTGSTNDSSAATSLSWRENPSSSAVSRAESILRVRRAFRHVATLRCRGRVGQASAEAMSAATAVARGAAATTAAASSASSVSPTSALLCLSASGLPFLAFTAVRAHLRVLDLSCTTISSLEGVEAFPLLERVIVTGCAQLTSLSPLGLAPALREIVASQSGIYALEGLAQSRSLVSLSLYGCLNLTDVSACGRVPTLRDLFISESTVEVVEGLHASRSLERLGMRYCDIPSLTALSSVASLRVLHASCSTLASVAALQHCALLEVVEVAACGQLLDLGPLGLAPSLVEVDATGSGVRHVDGLRFSTTLEKLRLAQCGQLEDVGRLGQCVRLRQLSLTGTPVRSLEGLAGAPALAWLDVSFCRQLVNFNVLLRLPELRRVLVAGCTAALRRPEDVRGVVESLCARRKRVEVVER